MAQENHAADLSIAPSSQEVAPPRPAASGHWRHVGRSYLAWVEKHVRSLDDVGIEAMAIRDRVLAGTEKEDHATLLLQTLRNFLRRQKKPQWGISPALQQLQMQQAKKTAPALMKKTAPPKKKPALLTSVPIQHVRAPRG